jgi:hypothetical protein
LETEKRCQADNFSPSTESGIGALGILRLFEKDARYSEGYLSEERRDVLWLGDAKLFFYFLLFSVGSGHIFLLVSLK